MREISPVGNIARGKYRPKLVGKIAQIGGKIRPNRLVGKIAQAWWEKSPKFIFFSKPRHFLVNHVILTISHG